MSYDGEQLGVFVYNARYGHWQYSALERAHTSGALSRQALLMLNDSATILRRLARPRAGEE